MKDGGIGDVDGIENGIITHTSGYDTSYSGSLSIQEDNNIGESGGIGCFIRSSDFSSSLPN